jgi:hypothetical protein
MNLEFMFDAEREELVVVDVNTDKPEVIVVY